MKKCGKCLITKSLNEFYKNKGFKKGRASYCISCTKKYVRENAEKVSTARKKCYHKNKGKRIVKMCEWHSSINGRARRLHESAKRRAKQKNISFTISLAQIYVLLFMGNCQRSGIKFDLVSRENTVMNPFAPSLDRIDSSKGYEPNNIQLVCNFYNMGKGQSTDKEFIDFCRIVTEYNREK